jgi:hypothetical protein
MKVVRFVWGSAISSVDQTRGRMLGATKSHSLHDRWEFRRPSWTAQSRYPLLMSFRRFLSKERRPSTQRFSHGHASPDESSSTQ